jgi:molecular chaperone DnaK
VLDVDNDLFEVRSTRGDTFLGGDNFDNAVVDLLLEEFKTSTGFDLTQNDQAFQRVKEAAETAKCELSSTNETMVSLPFIAMNDSGPLHLQTSIQRTKFVEILQPFVDDLRSCCKAALDDSNIPTPDIGSVILVGGSTRIPYIQNFVKTEFGSEPVRSVNPDEAVAIGAAIQGAILSGSLREVLLLDVTPLSLGIELAGGIFSALIARNSSIPTSHTRTFTTVRDNQPAVKVHVLQGERKKATENHSLGVFKLSGITPAPKEIPAIQVTFQIDANGILHVQAMDVTSGVSNQISIESYAASSTEKAEDAIRDAEEAAAADRDFIKQQFIRRQGDQILVNANAAGEDDDYPLPPELVRQVREAAFKLDVALSTQSDDIEHCYSLLKELGSEVDGHIAMVRHRRGEDSAEFIVENSDMD